MDSAATAQDVSRIWEELSKGIEQAYNCAGMTHERFMELYSHVYCFCAKDCRPKTIGDDGRDEWKKRRESARRRGYQAASSVLSVGFDGRDLYERIRNKVTTHLRELAQSAAEKDGENLLNCYLTHWNTFTVGSKVVDGTCSYLNRHWISREQVEEEGERVFPIYQLAMNIWKETLLEPFRDPMIAFILQLISRDRNGEYVDTRMIQRMTESLVELGQESNVEDGQVPNAFGLHGVGVSIYRARFEDDLIAATERHYAQESVAFLQATQSVPDYIRQVDQWLSDEAGRVRMYLHTSTLDRLMRTCETELIQRQLPALIRTFPDLLKDNRTEDMGRLYNLVSKITNSFQEMAEAFQTHVADEGCAAILLNKEKCSKTTLEYIGTILGVYRKFSDLVREGFRQNPTFVAAFDKGCGVFINDNEVTKGLPNKAPQMLAKYCDLLLKKGGKKHDDDELEELLNQAMAIFRFTENKDVFQNYYTALLANRLVGEQSLSDDAEASMILKLKIAAGFDFTGKMYRMMQDVGTCKTSREDFKAYLKEQSNKSKGLLDHAKKAPKPVPVKLTVDFSAMILQSGAWPFKQDTCKDFDLPQELIPCITQFTAFYKSNNEGRKLDWLYSKSHGEIVAKCFGQKTYTFIASTYGIAILLKYNRKDSYRIEELMVENKLTLEVIIPVVQQFLKSGLLKCDDAQDALSPTSVVYLFKEYNNKKLKLNLMAPLKTEVQKEDTKTDKAIEEQRKYEVKATIVRIMKARKEIGQQQLIIEVVQQLQSRFNPTIALINASIPDLIAREYLRVKDGTENVVYQYIA